MPRFLKRNPWLVAVFMLMLAALACDEYGPAKPFIKAVMVDKTKPGRAYAWLSFYTPAGEQKPTTGQTLLVYQTDDYGKTWQRSEFRFPDEIPQEYPLLIRDQAIRLEGRVVWTFPHRVFRDIFFYPDDTGYEFLYLLPAGKLSNSVADGVIYVAMGTEGVLVGHFEGAQPTWEHITWSLENSGIDALKPIKLTITDPAAISLIILMALLLPPLPLIHHYLLMRVWTYAMPDTRAAGGAAVVSLILSVGAAAAISVWLTDQNVDYYPMVAVMTVVTVLVSAVEGLVLMRDIGLRRRLWLALITALVALIVPIGVAAVWWLWTPIIFVLWGFETCRNAFSKKYAGFMRATEHPHGRWLTDRLALEAIVVSPIVMGILGVLCFRVIDWLRWDSLGIPAALLLFLAWGWFVQLYVAMRSEQLFMSGIVQNSTTPAVPMLRYSDHMISVLVWLGGAGVMAGVLFVAQSYVRGLFEMLVR